jgi:hypothetical protein
MATEINEYPEMVYVRGITQKEGEAFLEVKKIFRLTTAGKVLKKCLIEFVNIYKENEALKRDLFKKNQELIELKHQMGTICESFDVIKKFKKNNPDY